MEQAPVRDGGISSITPVRLVVIVGSTREGRFGPIVAQWFIDLVKQREDLSLDVLDLADVRLPVVLTGFGGEPVPQLVRDVSERLSAADAFVVVTPEYNHSFPASLKNAIDWFGKEWHAKPVGFVSYGGLAGGLRSVEQLRLVFAELHAVTVRDTVSFHNAGELFDDLGRPKDPSGCTDAAKVMLDQLVWWARALRDAKAVHAYGT